MSVTNGGASAVTNGGASGVVLLPDRDPAGLAEVVPPPFTAVTYPWGEPMSVPPEVLAEVTVYVPPYMGTPPSGLPLAGMPRLRLVQLLTVGYEAWRGIAAPPGASPDPAAAPGAGAGTVTVCNAEGVHEESTAEQALALILAVLRGVPGDVRAQDAGRWQHSRRQALIDSRVLILGAGNVGRAIAERLAPFGVTVTLAGRSARSGVVALGSTQYATALGEADIVILALPLTEATAQIMDATALARLRTDTLVVNVGRGGLVDTEALITEVAAGRLRCALDVTDPEPLPPGHPLWALPGALISPHVGGHSTAMGPRARALLADQCRRLRDGEQVRNVVA